MKDKSATGPDNISTRFLKYFSSLLSVPLELIFNKILVSGEMPDIWKHADVTPIFKGKGKRSEKSNYRPISLTCISCKISERLVKDHIVEYLSTNNVISTFQHGFMSQRSTESQLLVSITDWCSMLESGMYVDVVYLDISKAFDSVCHEKLLQKLLFLGIDGPIFNYIKSFLYNRTQRVKVGADVSSTSKVTSGVPQGSVLGPLLFLCYINDVVNVLKDSSIQIFADDSKIYIGSKDLNDVRLANDVSRILEWSNHNQLKLSLEKCTAMHFGSRNPKNKIYINNFCLPVENVTRDLGVFVSDDLKFSVHCQKIVCKALVKSNLIFKSFLCRDRKFLVNMFKTYVRCLLENNTCVWSPYLIGDINKVEAVQRKFTKRVPGLSTLSYRERLDVLELETLELRRLQFDLVQVFKILNGFVDVDKAQFFDMCVNSTRGHTQKLFLPRCSLNVSKFSFKFRVIEPWNSLTDSVVTAPTVLAFKSKLKKVNLERFLKYSFG